jgi:hypothetical protein
MRRARTRGASPDGRGYVFVVDVTFALQVCGAGFLIAFGVMMGAIGSLVVGAVAALAGVLWLLWCLRRA